jgi:beta-lactamase class A
MLGHLKACEDRDHMTRYLPAGTVVAHKPGAVDASKTDAGIIYTAAGPVAVCVMTDENEDQRWTTDNEAQVLIGRIAREAYDHFSAPRGK